MTSSPAKLSPEQAKLTGRALLAVFFIQGFIGLAVVARVPELMDQIHLDQASWGFVAGVSGAMGILSLFFGSRIIRRFATRPVLMVTGTIACSSVASYGFLNSGFQYFLMAATFSVSMSLFNLALNTNAVTFQSRQKKVILGKFHAAWSIGATATSAFGGVLLNFLSLQWHLLIVAALCMAAFWYFIRNVLPATLDGHGGKKKSNSKASFFKPPKLLVLLSAGMITGVMCEAMLIDWSSYFTQKTMGLPLAISAIPYTVFGLAMITGRLSVSHFAKTRHFSDLARIGGIFGSISLALAIFLGPLISQSNHLLGMITVAIFWGIAGFGIGPMMPSIASATGSVPNLDTTQAMARMSLSTSILMMLSKIFMGWLAAGAGLQIAFVFVVLCFFTAALIAGAVAKNLKADQITPNAFPATGAIAVLD